MRNELTPKQAAAIDTLPTFEMDPVTFSKIRGHLARQVNTKASYRSRVVQSKVVLAGAAAVMLAGATTWSMSRYEMKDSGTGFTSASAPVVIPNEFAIPKGLISFQPLRLDSAMKNHYKYISSTVGVQKASDATTVQSYSIFYAEVTNKVAPPTVQINETPDAKLPNGPLSGQCTILPNLAKYTEHVRIHAARGASVATNSYGTAIGYVLNHVKYEIMSQNQDVPVSRLIEIANHLQVPAGSVSEIRTSPSFFSRYQKEIRLRYILPNTPHGYRLTDIDAFSGDQDSQQVYFTYLTPSQRQMVQVMERSIHDAMFTELEHSKRTQSVIIQGHTVTTFRVPPSSFTHQYLWADDKRGLGIEVGASGDRNTQSAYSSVIASLF